MLRAAGHKVYDFKNPSPGNQGFHWSDLDDEWRSWSPEAFRRALNDPIARKGFKSDMQALRDCLACVLVLPCGRSAHLELGWAVGHGKKTIVLLDDQSEPELMYKMVDHLCLTIPEVLEKLHG